MADQTSIEWTDSTWTPVKGCTRKSDGCRNCYAEIMAARFSGPGQWGEGLATIVKTPQGKDHRWTGEVRFDEAELLKPLRWKRPRKVFVCSTADLFHEDVPDEWIDRVFAVMALCPQHIFQVLTKRADRMREYLAARSGMGSAPICQAINMIPNGMGNRHGALSMPLRNVWLGVSVEDQQRADERIPDLLATPATVRWLSCEPLLGRLSLRHLQYDGMTNIDALTGDHGVILPLRGRGRKLDWIVVGGESGPGARPMHPDWARSLRDQCAEAGVPFFFKQWGEWYPHPSGEALTIRQYNNQIAYIDVDTGAQKHHPNRHTDATMRRIGKKAAARLLDGREWNEVLSS